LSHPLHVLFRLQVKSYPYVPGPGASTLTRLALCLVSSPGCCEDAAGDASGAGPAAPPPPPFSTCCASAASLAGAGAAAATVPPTVVGTNSWTSGRSFEGARLSAGGGLVPPFTPVIVVLRVHVRKHTTPLQQPASCVVLSFTCSCAVHVTTQSCLHNPNRQCAFDWFQAGPVSSTDRRMQCTASTGP
jgi:hypothetical protein